MSIQDMRLLKTLAKKLLGRNLGLPCPREIRAGSSEIIENENVHILLIRCDSLLLGLLLLLLQHGHLAIGELGDVGGHGRERIG